MTEFQLVMDFTVSHPCLRKTTGSRRQNHELLTRPASACMSSTTDPVKEGKSIENLSVGLLVSFEMYD